MRRLYGWRNFKLTLLCSRSDGDGLGSVHASGESRTLGPRLLTYLKHGNSVMAINSIQTAIAVGPVPGNAEVKSP